MADAPIPNLGQESAVAKQGKTIPPTDILGQQAQIRSSVTSGLGNALGINDALRAARGELTPEEEQNFVMMAVMGAVAPELRGVGEVAAEASPSLAKSIRAYHGSPHDFERFDMSKIGTGEGAQSYGHGLYFAENPEVAKQYRKALGNTTVGGRSYDMYNPAHVAAILVDDFGDRQKAIEYLKKDIDPDFAQRGIDYLQSGRPLPEVKKSGRTYEVDIKADPEHFIDWDKPLSEQSQKVRETIARKFEGNDEISDIIQSATGESVIRRLLPMSGVGRGAGDVDHGAIAEALREAGIPGIKYLDQGSRGPAALENVKPDAQAVEKFKADWDALVLERRKAAGESGTGDTSAVDAKMDAIHKQMVDDMVARNPNAGQTFNYVVFDDKLIDIVKKYGWVALAALGLGGGAPQPDKN